MDLKVKLDFFFLKSCRKTDSKQKQEWKLEDETICCEQNLEEEKLKDDKG